jgi:hypothetical protein
MRTRSLAFLAALATAALPLAAQAQDADRPGFSVGVAAGTTGIGVDVIFSPNKHLDVRMNASYFSLSRAVDSDGISYDGTLTPESYSILADVYPFDFGMRVTGGMMVNRNVIKLNAKPSGPTQVGNSTYQPSDIGELNGAVTFRDVAPYVGLGYTTGRDRRGWGFMSDVGVMFSGSPRIGLAASGPVANVPGFAADLERERAEVEDDIKFVKYYPVIRFGAVYHF